MKCLKDNCFDPCYVKLDKHLLNGVQNSETKCSEIIEDEVGQGSTTYQTLSALCRNDGYFRSYNGQLRDLNTALAQPIYESIDEEFHAMFP